MTVGGTLLAGPFIVTSAGQPAEGGLVRVGALLGDPASSSIDDISLVFQEFGNYTLPANGQVGRSVSSMLGTPFNGKQIYLWVFDSGSPDTASEQALFTTFTKDPPGSPWIFPTHIGSGLDAATLHLPQLYSTGDASFTPGVQFLGGSSQLVLTPIPEPSAVLLLACTSFALCRRRRHRPF